MMLSTTSLKKQIPSSPCPQEELFLVTKDPHQLSNLAGNPEYAEALAQSRALVVTWTKQTGVPIP